MLQTIWLKLTWLDKAVILANVVIITAFLAFRWRNKRLAEADAETKKPEEKQEELAPPSNRDGSEA